VVTGAGLTVPLGLTYADVWRRCVRGESAIGPLRRFDARGHGCPASAEVPEFELRSVLQSPKNEKFMGPSVRCALHAAKAAVRASGIDLPALDPYRIAVYAGSGQTGLESTEFFAGLALAEGGSLERDYANLGGRASRLVDRYFSLRTLSNAGVGLLSQELGAKGPSGNFVQGDTASAQALASAVQDLAEGRSDVAIAGGYDSLLTVSTYLAYHEAGLLSASPPERAYRPFDRCRDGLVLGEGAAFLVLERAADARRRGGPVLGEILGVGNAMETADTRAVKASEAPLRAAAGQALRGGPVDFVVAHGIGTPEDDRAEARLIAATLGEGLPVTAFKSQTGYLGAATAAVELVLALAAAGARLVPPIARHHAADEGCRLPFVSGAPRPLSAETPTALCLAWSWFGQCTAIAVRAGAPSGQDRSSLKKM
jgi:3-oxoacyl-[acyl-carrier-protein] synthase II